jgi:hypothetical protein
MHRLTKLLLLGLILVSSPGSADDVTVDDVKRFLDPTIMMSRVEYRFQATHLQNDFDVYTHMLRPWYAIDALQHLRPLVSDPKILRELLDPGILPPDESPLLRSGLALAGADRREQTAEGEDDGILTAEEIAAMDLSGVEWAVLSACDTGLGEVEAGEGVVGLRRAFQIAGVRTLIMSLWSVDDESTRRWMTALYDARLRKGMSTAESVRHATLSVLNARREADLSTHPFHWAAFVAAGDWR